MSKSGANNEILTLLQLSLCGNPVGREAEELEGGSPEMVLRDEQVY